MPRLATMIPVRASIAIILIAACVPLQAGETMASTVPSDMRWRIFCDTASGTAFRFPYEFTIPDQYRGALRRSGTVSISYPKGTSPEKVRELLKQAWKSADKADIRHLHLAVADLPTGLSAADVGGVLKHLVGADIAETAAWSWYEEGNALRPHADPRWAPKGILAVTGTGAKHCAILLRHGDSFSGLIATGKPTDPVTQRIFASFEVLTGSGRERSTWRAAQGRKGQVFDGSGKALSASANKPASVGWAGAFETETEHYHLTCTASPARTAYYAAIMENLYKAYAGIFDPDQVPPYKLEIHILADQPEFQARAAKGGFPIGPGVMGFFAPGQLCIYAFDQIPPGIATECENVLAHEASHQFLHVTCNGSDHVPTWINEGLAVYFESGVYKPGQLQWKPPSKRLAQLKQAYATQRDTLMPLEDHLKHYGHIPGDVYAEVYAITHFWIYGVKDGKRRFKLYWNALKEGEDGTESFERIFMEDLIKANNGRSNAFEAWKKALLTYVTKGMADKVPG